MGNFPGNFSKSHGQCFFKRFPRRVEISSRVFRHVRVVLPPYSDGSYKKNKDKNKKYNKKHRPRNCEKNKVHSFRRKDVKVGIHDVNIHFFISPVPRPVESPDYCLILPGVKRRYLIRARYFKKEWGFFRKICLEYHDLQFKMVKARSRIGRKKTDDRIPHSRATFRRNIHSELRGRGRIYLQNIM